MDVEGLGNGQIGVHEVKFTKNQFKKLCLQIQHCLPPTCGF